MRENVVVGQHDRTNRRVDRYELRSVKLNTEGGVGLVNGDAQEIVPGDATMRLPRLPSSNASSATLPPPSHGSSQRLLCTTLSFATPCRFIPALSRHECPRHGPPGTP